MKHVYWIITLMTAISAASIAHADGDEAAKSKFGKDSAVTAFDSEEGFKMNETALSSLGVQFRKLEGSGAWSIPKDALVRIKHVTGVYRRVEGWISFVLVETPGKSNGQVTIRSEDLQAGDEVAVEGASFLRMTEADLNADTVDSCAH
jgi:hypothetical protein